MKPAVQAQKRQEPIEIGNDSICEPPSGPLPDAAALGHWFAGDLREHKRSFGFAPPDSISVVLVPDSATRRRADKAVDSQFAKWARASRVPHAAMKSATPDTGLYVLVYRAQNIYAVVDAGQQFCGGDPPPLPIVFFFDTKWRYLGSRSK